LWVCYKSTISDFSGTICLNFNKGLSDLMFEL